MITGLQIAVHAIIQVNLITAQNGIFIRANGLTPNLLLLFTLQQIRHLTGGKFSRRLTAGFPSHICCSTALYIVANAILNFVAAILGTTDQIVAVADGAAICTHHAADIIVASTDATGVVAVADGAIGVEAHHAADSRTAADGAGVVTSADGVIVAAAHHTTDITRAAAYISDVVAVADGSRVVVAHNATDIFIAADGAGVVTSADGVLVAAAHHTTDIFIAADGAGAVTIADGATVADKAHHATGTSSTAD